MEKAEKRESKTDKKVERQVFWIFFFLAVIFISFAAGYILLKPEPYFEYRGFKVYKVNMPGVNVDFYKITIQDSRGTLRNLIIRSDPRALEGINATIDTSLYGNISEVWVTADTNLSSESIIAKGEIGQFLAIVGLNVRYAVTNSMENYPQMDCSNATSSSRVIEIRQGDSTGLHSEGYCMVVEGKDEKEMIRAADKFVMIWLERLIIGVKSR